MINLWNDFRVSGAITGKKVRMSQNPLYWALIGTLVDCFGSMKKELMSMEMCKRDMSQRITDSRERMSLLGLPCGSQENSPSLSDTPS